MAMPWGSAEWRAEVTDPIAVAFAADGGAGRLQHVVSGGPDGDVRYSSVVSDGGAVLTTAGDIDEPDLTFTSKKVDALAVLRGEVSPNVAYMRGRLKPEGHTGLLLQILAATEGDAYEQARAELAARTD